MSSPPDSLASGAPSWREAIIAPDTWPDHEPPIRWVVPALRLAPGRMALAVGPGGVGKSLLLGHIGALLLGGLAGLDGLVQGGEPRRVLWIDADQGIQTTRRRFRRQLAALGVSARPTLVPLGAAVEKGFRITNAANWRELLAGFDLAIIDSLARLLSLAGLDENDAGQVRNAFGPLLEASEQTACATIALAHTGHADADGVVRKRARGSSAIEQAAGAVWSISGSTTRGTVRSVELLREGENDDGEPLVTSWAFIIGPDDDSTVQRVDPPRAKRTGEDATPAEPSLPKKSRDPKTERVLITALRRLGGKAPSGNDLIAEARVKKPAGINAIQWMVLDRVVQRHPSGSLVLAEALEGTGGTGSVDSVPPAVPSAVLAGSDEGTGSDAAKHAGSRSTPTGRERLGTDALMGSSSRVIETPTSRAARDGIGVERLNGFETRGVAEHCGGSPPPPPRQAPSGVARFAHTPAAASVGEKAGEA